MRILNILIFLIPAMLLAQETPLSDSEISNFKDGIVKQTHNLNSLSSDFVQTKHIQLMEDKTVSKGSLYYRSPNVLKWEYNSPYSYKILFKDNQLHIDDEGDKSVTSLKSNKLFEKLVGLISGSVNGKLLADTENFEINFFHLDDNILAVIVPHDQSLKDMFHEIILIFNHEHLLDSVKLMEEEGDYTHIEFENIKLNPDLKDTVFQN